MNKQFNLSEVIIEENYETEYEDGDHTHTLPDTREILYKRDVKEFIRLLKEELSLYYDAHDDFEKGWENKIIDKLAGEKLT